MPNVVFKLKTEYSVSKTQTIEMDNKEKDFSKDYVKLNYQEFMRLTEGTLLYVEHPLKGSCLVDYDNIYILTK